MITLKDIRLANKQRLEWGKWEDTKMTSSVFPLSRRRQSAFKLGTAYRWRLVRFEACGRKFRLLVAFSLAKQQYRAMLALEVDMDLSVLASYEYHGTHPGWHVSASCGDISEVPPGVLIGPWQTRLPKARQRHRSTSFNVTDDDTALDVAARFFRLHKAEGQLL